MDEQELNYLDIEQSVLGIGFSVYRWLFASMPIQSASDQKSLTQTPRFCISYFVINFLPTESTSLLFFLK